MTRRNPPALAIRLLHFCVPFCRREALLGDLLEKFAQGRSSHWVWREVLIVIVLSVCAWFQTHLGEIAFAVIGTTLVQLWWRTSWWKIIWQSSTVQSLCGWGVGGPFPLSVIYDLSFHAVIDTVPILALLAVFWSINNLWRWASLRNTFFISLMTFTVGQLIMITVPPVCSYFLSPISFFLALVISMASSRDADAAIST